jgi:pilus assembly protein CpaC
VAAAALKAPTDRVKPPHEADLFFLGRTDTGVPMYPGAPKSAPRATPPSAPPAPLGGGGMASRDGAKGVGPTGVEKEYGHVF